MNRLARRLGALVPTLALAAPAAVAVAAFGALAALAAPLPAHAVELYWDPDPGPPPPPARAVVYVQPNDPVVLVEPALHADVHVDVDVGAQPARPRDPYDTSSIVIAGAGVGGIFFFGDGMTGAAAAYKLHVGVAVGQASFSVRFDLVPDATEVQAPAGGLTPAALYTAGAMFGYRFLPGAVVHPVAGVGLETIVVDPHEGQGGQAFAGTLRAGLELAYPLADGALALGIDATGHHPFGASDSYPMRAVDMLSFGAYADYRF